MTRPGLLNRIAKAKAEIREMKRTTPHIFPQWQAMKHAEDEFKKASANLERARAEWESLGKQ